MATEPRSKGRALWVLTGLVALTFVVTGGSKLAAVPPSPENFARWGFSPAFMMGVGIVEIVGGLGLLVRPVAPFAAAVLLVTMAGAVKTGIAYSEAMHVALPLVLMGMLAVILYGRRKRA